MIWGNKEPAIKDREAFTILEENTGVEIHKMAVWSQDCLNYYLAILDAILSSYPGCSNSCVSEDCK